MTRSEIDSLAAGLRGTMEAEDLWERIETALHREKRSHGLSRLVPFDRKIVRLSGLGAAVAAALFLMLILPAVMEGTVRPPSPILDGEEAAILTAELEEVEREMQQVEPRFRQETAARGNDAAMVCGQIAFLDSNIETCRTLAAGNGLNRGINRSLLDCSKKRLAIMRQYLTR